VIGMNRKRTIVVFIIVLMAMGASLFMFSMPDESDPHNKEAVAVVEKTDDSAVERSGLVLLGGQRVWVRIIRGSYKGERVEVANTLLGKIDMDTLYTPGDKILITLRVNDAGGIKGAKTLDRLRQGWIFALFSIYALLLLLFARMTGVKALFSFIVSLLLIWKVLVPALLSGRNPLVCALGMLIVLSALILFSVSGFTKRGLAAFLGTLAGMTLAGALAIAAGNLMDLWGMTAPYAETLLFSGFFNLDFRDIFYAAIAIGASGAAMDISMDVSASMWEILEKKPEIGRQELVRSGYNVGRAVIGTMTTTLLLMLFYTKDTSLMRMLNLRIVAAEMMRTLVGSIGLVTVAPATAWLAGRLFCQNGTHK
jgi:uncharacterized membrane protein